MSGGRGAPGTGVSPAGAAAAAAVQALVRAARSFALYDPGNALVRGFLAEYGGKTRAALDAHGALSLEVRPRELALAGEIVYREEDREKSLAAKLFGDGVRRLVLLPEVTWPELLRLLEVLAVRFAGLRRGEEDTVTLLRKSELRGVHVQAVAGLAAAEEGDEESAAATTVVLPVAWDLPLPRLPRPGPLAYVPLQERELQALRSEVQAESSTELAISVARDLAEEASRAGWPMPDPDLSAFCTELRDAFLADGQLAAIRRLVDVLGPSGGALREEVMRGLADARTLSLVLDAVPEEAGRLPADLIPLFSLLGIEPVLDALSISSDDRRRRLLLQIALARLPREADALLARLGRVEAPLARELARGLVARAPERAAEVARQLLSSTDESSRLEGVAALEAASGELPLRPVCELLRDRSEDVRVRVAALLGRRGDASIVAVLRAELEGDPVPSLRACDAFGRAMADAAPIQAARLLAGWLEPKARFLRGAGSRERALQWAAVAGFGCLPGTEPEAALTGLAARAEPEVRRHCLETLARRKKERDAAPR